MFEETYNELAIDTLVAHRWRSQFIRATSPHRMLLPTCSPLAHARLSGARHGTFAARKAVIDFSIARKSRRETSRALDFVNEREREAAPLANSARERNIENPCLSSNAEGEPYRK